MIIQVHGELDIPKEVTELLTGMSYSRDTELFQDIEIKLSQTALDRLSVILHLLYATQPIEEVKAYLNQVKQTVVQQVITPPVTTTPQPYVPVPYVNTTPVQNQPQPEVKRTKPSNAVTIGQYNYPIKELGAVAETKKQSIAALGNKIRGRVG